MTARRARVRAFVRRNFGIRGSLRLHRTALGWDMLRAPVNVMLAPVFLGTRLIAAVLALLRLRRAAGWFAARQILFRSRLATQVQDLIRGELLDTPDGRLPPRQERLLDDYTSVRSAVSEITTMLLVLTLGALVFRTATPGIVSLAPTISDIVAHSTAVADFPLGSWLGGVWYGVFPAHLPVWYVVAIGIALGMVAATVTTFAGIIADPVQAALGIHQRRLMRLLAALDAADDKAPSLAKEHIVARMGDIADAATSLMRIFRS
ncbi:MAG: hypothetical protein KDA73_14535 [Rhodobacteraceae bacterium]|nr:hypothetical protein [Paracoccaceae bacterium]